MSLLVSVLSSTPLGFFVTDPSQDQVVENSSRDPGTTSLSLLARWQRNDPKAWERMTYLYYPLVYGWCRRAKLQPDDSRDVTQEVFQALARSGANFRSEDGRNSFRGWLWGVTRNQIKNFWRRLAKQPQAIGGEYSQVDLQQLPQTEDAWDQLTDPDSKEDDSLVVKRAMELIRAEFEETSWLAFWRSAVDGRPASDVAADLGITRNAVYLAKSRILKRLRSEFTELLDF